MGNNDEGRAGSEMPEDKLILIVDDDESAWDLLYYIVRREGFRTEQASDGREALDKARLLRPSLILLDMMLPKLGGYEIIRELQDGDTSDIPVVMLTSRGMDRSTVEVLRQEPNLKDFMEKPVNHQTLVGRLHALLGTRPRPKEKKE
ncbi:MAG: response regulator [Nitrospiraceae bacterium]|nr:response regulator [Nitrospiraceae bacterium]